MFFESAVDLLLFADLKINHHGKDLNGYLLVSIVGLKPNIVKHIRHLRPEPQHKDWNELLKAMKKQKA